MKTLLIAWLLSTIPFGTYFYNWSQQGLDASTRMEWTHYCGQYVEDSTNLPLPKIKPQGTYTGIKSSIKTQQAKFQQQYQAAQTAATKDKIAKEAGLYVTEQLINGLFPHWYGTTWSFDGYTSVPNKGKVGCSYFVSTTLLHAGFNLNRYTLAQQGPVSEAQSLALGQELIEVEVGLDFQDFVPTIEAKCKEGLYFIGLGHSHVGYLFYREGEVYFMQSSYGKSMSVVIDYADESDILNTFGSFVLVPITTSTVLMEKWLTGGEISIIKGTD